MTMPIFDHNHPKIIEITFSFPDRAYFSHLLGAVPTRSALFEKQNTLFSDKTFKTTCCLGGCSIPNALNLNELGVKTRNCALLWDFFALFCYTAHMPLFSRISPGWICTSIQKIISFHHFIHDIQSILGFHDQTGHTHFWPCPPKNFFINFWFMWICIKMQKINLLHWFVLEIRLIKKSCNLIDWERFGPYLRNKNFPQIWDLCSNTANSISFCYWTNSVKINDQIFQ